MELKAGLSAIVTGGAAGIGRALAIALAQKGIFITIIDFSQEKGIEAASLAEEQVQKFHADLKFPAVLFFRCDVSNSNELAAAFRKHVETYGGLDICINCAGISNPLSFYEDQTDGFKSWRRAVDINFVAVIESTRLAFVQTELTAKMDPKFIDTFGGFMSTEMVVKGAFNLISDESKAGACLWISNKRGFEYCPTPAEEEKYRTRSKASRKKSADVLQVNIEIPRSFDKIVVHTLSHNFQSATRVVRAPLRLPLKPDYVLMKIIYAGVNASDVNFSSGRYFSGSSKDTASLLPFDAGFEAVGIIAAIGDSVKHLKVGTPAAIMTYGSYAEFTAVPSKNILPVARPDPEVVAMLTSGLTASIALEKAAQMDSGKTVLITAAAGGTGQFAVQPEIRVIDYKAENIKTVLKDEFPKGVDIIYESVGGEMFDLCLNALATYGRLIVIGMISQYQGEDGWKPQNYTGLCEKILAKSQTVTGFFLVHYAHFWQEHLDKLMDLYTSGKLKVIVDPKTFLGVHSVADAVNYLHSGHSVGKVVVCMDPMYNNRVAKL
ncbi:15-hydroxyprostaglandin dehydrogenase (NAD(+)) [Salvia divinorum]|uniref:15-hydroxyprostaglandin dehydrogenase (NAD(+)) n=1 Tax=Salvia divinorum TaxID=28513 RepID=A0ABD1HYZ1_SALDI